MFYVMKKFKKQNKKIQNNSKKNRQNLNQNLKVSSL